MRNLRSVLLAGPGIFACFAFGFPLILILASSIIPDRQGEAWFRPYSKLLFDSYYWEVLWTTIRIALMTTLNCVVVGYPIAYYLARVLQSTALRRVCLILTILPLFTSNVIRSFAWMILLGRTGIVNETLISVGFSERPVRFLGSETGIIIGLTYILLPIMILNIANALSAMDPLLEQASADLGATPASTFRLIVLPATMPSVFSGAITVFALSMSAYVTPAILSGGKVTVFPMLIFQQYNATMDYGVGAALSVMLVGITAILIVTARGTMSRPGSMS